MSENVTQVKTSLKTVYSILEEVSTILDKPIDQLEYLNEGSAPKDEMEKTEQDNNPTITVELLMKMCHTLSRKASEVAKQTNHLTGQ